MEEAIAPIGSDISIDDGEPGENPEPVAPENRAGDNPEDDDGGDGLGRARRHLDEDGEPDNREGESVDDPEGAAPVEPEEDFDDGGQRKKRQDAAAAARPVNPCTRKDCPDNFDCVVRRVCPRPRQCRLVARCVRDRDNTRSKEND
ncbi:hypothetical protein AAVH_06259 [Aphelenchoides avenae]|nr:hypothetical protein AAVH_06259 [Aphelenchus avenae]